MFHIFQEVNAERSIQITHIYLNLNLSVREIQKEIYLKTCTCTYEKVRGLIVATFNSRDIFSNYIALGINSSG
jgi:hypothetical protein